MDSYKANAWGADDCIMAAFVVYVLLIVFF